MTDVEISGLTTAGPAQGRKLVAPDPGASGASQDFHFALFVDENGDWFHQGNRITRPEILEALYEKLDFSEDGRFFLAGETGSFFPEVADTPFVVSRVDRTEARQGGEQIELRLRHLPRPEALDPATLAAGRDNVLYCRVKNGRFPARFSRPAYYQIAEFIEEDQDSGAFFIELNGTRYPISSSWEGHDREV
jgi:uncharacterized protein